MNRPLDDLHLQRGRLIERIAAQRAALIRDAQPVAHTLHKADIVVARVQAATSYVKRHPGIALLAMGGLFVFKGDRLWRWARRGFVAWRTWRALYDRWQMLAARPRL